MIGIYKITNKLNNKVYIGQSINIKNRLYDHFDRQYSDITKCHGILDKEIRKLGKENFTYEILIECSLADLNTYEKYYIDFYHSNDPEKGYNRTGGGSSINNGQSKKIINIDTLEIYDSTVSCAKELNLSQGDLVRVCNHLHGSIQNQRFMYLDEYNEKGIVEYVPLPHGSTSKKVQCIETGQIFESAHEAGRQMNLNYRLISSVCNGKRNTTGGFRFIYL